MRPTDQTIFGVDGPVPGNCFQAVMASMLELPLEDVPHFCARGRIEEHKSEWAGLLSEFLAPRGLQFLSFNAMSTNDWKGHPLHEVFVEICGKSPRGDFMHSVVGALDGNGWRIVHDPHPSRDGLAEAESIGFFVARMSGGIHG